MKTLLDTCVLAELYKPDGLASVRQAVTALADDSLYLSVVTVGEISKGIALLPESRRRQDITAWLRSIQTVHAGRVLPVDAETAMIWGEMTAKAQTKGITIPASDGLIAATALRHGLRLMTRNVRDFRETGVVLVNPWDTTP